MTQPGWSERLVKVIAGEVRRHRLARDLSAQQLADRCAELGHPIPRSVLANLESGRRETITVPELLVLARALEVPPVLLLFPLGRVEQMEVLPGRDVATWPALLWFTGEYPAGSTIGPDAHDRDDWQTVNLFRSHQQLVTHWLEDRARLDRADQPGLMDYYAQTIRSTERGLVNVRADMRKQGLTPPGLPDELRHIEGGQR